MADNDLIRLDPPTDTPYPLGRHVWHDPQNRQHRARAARAATLPDRYMMWYSPEQFNQQGSSCTMQSNVKMCMSGKNRTAFKKFWPNWDTENERHAGYILAQDRDPFPGREPEVQGSSSDAPLKLLRELGHISGWKWLFGLDELKQWVMYKGAVVVGTTWLNSMFNVDKKKGYMVFDPTSGNAGGHAWCIVGYSPARKAFRMHNSWGKGWGQNGRAWIREEDLRVLLADQGEAVTVTL